MSVTQQHEAADKIGAAAGPRWLPPNAPLLRLTPPVIPNLPNVYWTVRSFLQAFAVFSRVYEATDEDASRWMLLCVEPTIATSALEKMSSPTEKSRLLEFLGTLPDPPAAVWPAQPAALPGPVPAVHPVKLENGAHAQKPVAFTYRQMGHSETVSEHCLKFFNDLLPKTPVAERQTIITKSTHVNGFISSLTPKLRAIVERKGPYSTLEHVMREAKNFEAHLVAESSNRDDSGVDMQGIERTTVKVEVVEKGGAKTVVKPASLFSPAPTAQPDAALTESSSAAGNSNEPTFWVRNPNSNESSLPPTYMYTDPSDALPPPTVATFYPPPPLPGTGVVPHPFWNPGVGADGYSSGLPPPPSQGVQFQVSLDPRDDHPGGRSVPPAQENDDGSRSSGSPAGRDFDGRRNGGVRDRDRDRVGVSKKPMPRPSNGRGGSGGVLAGANAVPVPSGGRHSGSGGRMPDLNGRLVDPNGHGRDGPSHRGGVDDSYYIDRRGSSDMDRRGSSDAGRSGDKHERRPSVLERLGGAADGASLDESESGRHDRKRKADEEGTERARTTCRIHGSGHSNEDCLVQNPTANVAGKLWCDFHGWCTHTEAKCVKRGRLKY